MSGAKTLGPILVTGGAGWLGSCIVEALLADGSFSPVVSTVEPHLTSIRKVKGAIYHDCNLLEPDQVNRLLDTVKPRVVLHTAGPGFFAPPADHYRITYDLSKQLIPAVKRHPGVQALVYTCTAEAVALKPSHNDHPVREDEVELYSLHHGPMAYSRTKAAIDVLVREANTPEAYSNPTGTYTDQLLTAVLRVTGLYGPRDKQSTMEMMKLLHTPRTWFQIGPNALVHDWVYVDSCAQAHVLAAKALLRSPAGPNGESERADGQAFNISDGAPMPFWDFPRKLWREAGDANWAPDGPHRVIQIPFWVVLFAVALLEWVYWVCTLGLRRPGSSSQTFAYMKTGCWLDIGKARRVLGYEPLCGTEEGIRRTVEWLRDNGFLDDKRKLE